MWHIASLTTLLTLLLGYSTISIADDYIVGVRANRGVEQAITQWQPTIDYLNQKIPEHKFSTITYPNNSSLNQALSRAEFDFVLTNSAAHVEHVKRYAVRPIATLINKRGNQALTQYGSVIFVRSDRNDINSLHDLKGKSFMGVDELGFGGWRAAWYEMLQNKINPYKDFSSLIFAGGKQQRVVQAVLSGKVDAGSVRTDLLERMAQRNVIKLTQIKVLNLKSNHKFPFLRSSELYPEWPFAVLSHTPMDVTQLVASALVNILPTNPAALQGKYIGWTAPMDYSIVDATLKELLVGPYSHERIGLLNFIQHYWPFLILAIAVFVIVGLTALHYIRLNRKLAITQNYLVDEIQSRKKAEEILHHLALNAIKGQSEEAFLKECVSNLSHFYQTKFAFVGLFDDKNKTSITTKAVWANDHFAENFSYDLHGTPCQDVLNRNTEIIHTGASTLYPEDQLLIDMGVDSYYGAPIITHNGRTLGLISVMDTRPMNPTNWARDLISVFASRIGMELDRLHAEQELQDTAEELSYLASHDSLTGLVNRREFERRLQHALEDARIEHKSHACCYLDLDQFKIVNDTSGHIAGDELLKQLTHKLEQYVRNSDTLARLGGDEFGLILADCPQEKAIEIAEEMRKTVHQFHFNWEGTLFDVGVSIGLVMFDKDSESLEDIFTAADSACYVAKEKGRNRVHVFQAEDEDHVRRTGQLQWASRISTYLQQDRFLLYRQDIGVSNITEQKNNQFEILLRYKDDDGMIKEPAELIVAAERYGLMKSIDYWVFDSSCRYVQKLYKQSPEPDNIICHINISGISLLDEEFQKFVSDIISEYQLPFNIFCLEITETAAISNLTMAINFIHTLKNLGVRFALDDFGSGMSSFNYLKHLPVDYLKIDGHIVRDASRDNVNRTMLKSIHDIGSALNIKTIAESVETSGILDVVEEIGIDLIQGFYIDKPHPIQ